MSVENPNREICENEYKPGDKKYYHESGEIFSAEILENNSDSRVINYKLRLTHVIKTNSGKKLPEGWLEINCMKANGAHGATWRLLEYIDDQFIHGIWNKQNIF